MAGGELRVEPPFVEFSDVRVGEVYKTTITITNAGKTSKRITIEKPETKLFKFTAWRPTPAAVAPGLSVGGLLEFTPTEEEKVRDRLLIHVDSAASILEVPLLGIPTTCCLLMDSEVDFGCVVASSQMISKQHPITNQGSAPGAFQVRYHGDSSVSLSPCSGVIAAGATEWLKVELHTGSPKRVAEKAQVKFQNAPAVVVLSITAEVVDQQLQTFDLQESPLSCLWFGPVYFGTSLVEHVVLRNSSPQPCDWICLIQEDAAGTEVGTDLQKSTDATLLERRNKCIPVTHNASHVLMCVPKQGKLPPFGKITVAVRFSPVCKRGAVGMKRSDPNSRQDYCLFLLFDCVGSKHGFTRHSASSSVELAVTGTGLPVSLVPSPSDRFDFPCCAMGQRGDLLCMLQNLCPQLPVSFRFRKLPHFSSEPSAGTIAPGQYQDVVLTFSPRQQGSFHMHQKVAVLGHVISQKDGSSSTELELCNFHTITLHFFGVCHSETKHPVPKLNLSNLMGPRPHVKSSELARWRALARAAVLSADKTRLHEHRSRKSIPHTHEDEFLAFPSDRASSIRPTSPNRHYRTIFTGVQRHCYVDTDYAFTRDEAMQRERHRQVYADFITQLRQTRLQRVKERKPATVEVEVDIGMLPAQGLVPLAVSTRDLDHSETEPNCSCPGDKANTQTNTTSLTEQVPPVISAVPTTNQEVADCNRALTAEELYQVEIGPLSVDFGEVCVNSVCVEKLALVNNLGVHVWVQLEVDIPELRGSSPLFHVLPPRSRSSLPLTFQTDKLGSFYGLVTYTVNQQHPGQILVQAQVVPVDLELSTDRLVMHPTPGLLAAAGYRSSVTLRNQRNHAAVFTWSPVVTERGILFTVRPATGVVEPYKELNCEVVWHASFSSPAEGDFILNVHEGTTRRLHCSAKVGTTTVELAEKQVTFGSVPLNMPSTRTAVLHNTGPNHAYYQVLDVLPLPGMRVSPAEGTVPSRGQAVLQIHFKPNCVVRFDTRVEIALQNMKSIELRVGGSVEPPNVHFSVSQFLFSGVYVGSQRLLSFSMTNKSSAAAHVTFDLSEYGDFSIRPSTKKAPGVSVVEVEGLHTADCAMVFSPTQVASYDFTLSITINGVPWSVAHSSLLTIENSSTFSSTFCVPVSHFSSSMNSSSTSSTITSSSSTSYSTSSSKFSSNSSAFSSAYNNNNNNKHKVKPLAISGATEVKHQSPNVHATVLCAPLEVSPCILHFNDDVYTKKVELRTVSEDSVCWSTITGDSVHWWCDRSAIAAPTGDRSQGELCGVFPSWGQLGPGKSTWFLVSIQSEAFRKGLRGFDRVINLSLPLYLGDKRHLETRGVEGQQPYRELSIIITLQVPTINIHPPQVLLSPVPLRSDAKATLTLVAGGYPRGTSVSAEVEKVELGGRTEIQLVTVSFPEGNAIPAQKHNQQHEAGVSSLTCTVTFSSAVPLSLRTTITFYDHLRNSFKVQLCATTDNCLLTVWPYMALHMFEHRVVLKTGGTSVEAVLQRHLTPTPTSCQTSSVSSFNHDSSATQTSESYPDSDSGSGQASEETSEETSRETCGEASGETSEETSVGGSGGASREASGETSEETDTIGEPSSSLSFPESLTDNTAEGLYHRTVELAVESWFSLFGWPGGQHPITVPQTLRRVVSKTKAGQSSGRTYRVSQNKDSRSVLDMLHHLTGTQIPGIPRCQILPSDMEQRTNQVLQEHEAVLDFLRVQGACLGHIRPQYLLDVLEFKHWCSKQSQEAVNYSSVDYESLSKRSWTDVLMQIYKVLVLSRVPKKTSVDMTLSHTGTDEVSGMLNPLDSNIYSPQELELLSWLNVHYHDMRQHIWGAGNVTSTRWIVNFNLDLTDGLVLAALLAAYCPYLITSHFQRMYTSPTSLEQIQHNNIIVAQALTALSLSLNVLPTDLSDPNPVQMLMLCVHLYERLPQYVPVHTIVLSGGLHGTFSKQVCLKNPSTQPVRYRARIVGDNAPLFSLPGGSTVTIPPKSSREVTVHFSCFFLKPMKAALLLLSNTLSGLRGATLAFTLSTLVTHVTPTKTVQWKSPCYQLEVIQVPLINTFDKEGNFRVVLVETVCNPLEPETKTDHLAGQTSSKVNTEPISCDTREAEEDSECSEFTSAVKSVHLQSGQTATLTIHYLPFSPGIKYCSVLLVCPQVGDMVYVVKASSQLPLPSPLTARPSANIMSILINSAASTSPGRSAKPVCVSVLSLQCKVGQLCEVVLRVPRINMRWEQALSLWAQHGMGAEELRRRRMTHTLHSSTVRAAAAIHRLHKHPMLKGAAHSRAVEYTVEVSLPQYCSLPSTVKIPITEGTQIPWDNPADCGCVEIPVRFQADSVGQFTCEVVLRSWCDTRLHLLEALVTPQEGFAELDFTSPAHQSVTQQIPMHNETQQDWDVVAELSGGWFSGPSVLSVPAGTRAYYPLTFHPAAQGTVKGQLSLDNYCGGTKHVFTLRGVGEHPLPVKHVVLHCPVGTTAGAQLDVPNYSQKKLTLKVVTDLSIVSGPPFLQINPGHSVPYALTVSPWKRGKHTGCVSFVEQEDLQEASEHQGSLSFSLHRVLQDRLVTQKSVCDSPVAIICEPPAPVKVINVQCVIMTLVAIEISVNNPGGEVLMLDVRLEGDYLSGASRVSVPPQGALVYKASFSPSRVGRSTGSVLFQSEQVGEFWYHLELYALPPPVMNVPQVWCQLGKWCRLTIPLVNPTAETLQLTVTNSNPSNYTLETDTGGGFRMEPHSSAELGIRFHSSNIGEGNHKAKITFTCPQLQEWCVQLRGCGLKRLREEPLSISSAIGCSSSLTIPFTNPLEHPALLTVGLTDEDPSEGMPHLPASEKEVFSTPLTETEGLQMDPGASVGVPVVFEPTCAKLQRAWLSITLTPLSCMDSNENFTKDSTRFIPEPWIYPLCGIPMDCLAEHPPLGVLQCDAGCQVEKMVDVCLTGFVPGTRDRQGQEGISSLRCGTTTHIQSFQNKRTASVEDFQCEVFTDNEADQDWIRTEPEEARRDPEDGIIRLSLKLVWAPARACRSSGVLKVWAVSGKTWEFPITLEATEPRVDDVILMETTKVGQTSAVGFRLTSTTRRSEAFTVALLPGSSSTFTVSPPSGTLPPAGSAGALLTVFFTPTAPGIRHRATLAVLAADMRWVYEVKARAHQDSATDERGPSPSDQRNVVGGNHGVLSLAKSSPLKARR